MRHFTFATVLGLVLSFQAAHSQERPAAAAGPLEAVTLSPKEKAAHSAALAKAARDKEEELERARDLRMREISKGICTGC